MSHFIYIQQTLSKAWKSSLCLFILVLSALTTNAAINADLIRENEDSLALALRLETEFWSEVVLQNIIPYSSQLSSNFQDSSGAHIFSRDEFITILASSRLRSFEITNPVAYRSDDVLVFSYNFNQTDSISLPSGPSLSVWQFQRLNTDEISASKNNNNNQTQKQKRREQKRERRQNARGYWKMVSHSGFIPSII